MLGCERVIQGTTLTPDSIPKRWMSKINYRLRLDWYIAAKWNKKPITRDIVRRTREPLLQTFAELDECRITNTKA